MATGTRRAETSQTGTGGRRTCRGHKLAAPALSPAPAGGVDYRKILKLTGPWQFTPEPFRLTQSAPMRAATMTPTVEITATPHSGNPPPVLALLPGVVGDGVAPPLPGCAVGVGPPNPPDGAGTGVRTGGTVGADGAVGAGTGALVGAGAVGSGAGLGMGAPPPGDGGEAAMVLPHNHAEQSPFHLWVGEGESGV